MFAIIAKTATLMGVVDTDDNCVEWYTAEQIYSYVNAGVNIAGVLPNGDFEVNPAYYADYTTLKFGNNINIFEGASAIRVGNRGSVEFVCNKKLYKMRLLVNSRVDAGSTYQIKGYVLQVPVEGFLVKLSNGICTILPTNVFLKFAHCFKRGV